MFVDALQRQKCVLGLHAIINKFDRGYRMRVSLDCLCYSFNRCSAVQVLVRVIYNRRLLVTDDLACSWNDVQCLAFLEVCKTGVHQRILLLLEVFELAITLIQLPKLTFRTVSNK